MKKLITLVLIILLIGLIGSCWFNQKEEPTRIIDPREQVVGEMEVLHPVKSVETEDGVKATGTNRGGEKEVKYLSSTTTENLLFDAPAMAKYLLSSSKELAVDKVLKVDVDGDKRLESFTLGLDHPNGVRVLVAKDGVTYNLMNSVTDEAFFDDYGDLLPGNTIQVTVLDIDRSSGKELVVSVGQANKKTTSYFFYFDKSDFKLIGKLEAKGAFKLVENKLLFTSPAGVKETFTLYQKQLAKIVI